MPQRLRPNEIATYLFHEGDYMEVIKKMENFYGPKNFHYILSDFRRNLLAFHNLGTGTVPEITLIKCTCIENEWTFFYVYQNNLTYITFTSTFN